MKRQKTDVLCPRTSTGSDKVLNEAFAIIDTDGNGQLGEDEFVLACQQMGFVDESGARRLFAWSDADKTGYLSLAQFRRAVRRRKMFQAIVSDLTKEEFIVSADYDCTKSTSDKYQHHTYRLGENHEPKQKEYDEKMHGKLVGDYVQIRQKLDFSWHKNFTEERQLWQDRLVRGISQTQEPEYSPWLVFTCGAMGAGKGFTMSWMSNNNIFPLERVVHIDPDMCKHAMPEWQLYLQQDKKNGTKNAGSMCHMESGLLQELAQELALRGGGNVWVDGSLQDFAWYRDNVIPEVRKRFPQYRIAIFHVHCQLETVSDRSYPPIR
jgi:hypothetical protein